MAKLTTHERIRRMYEHKEADRVPIVDYPWSSTVERWHQQGLPEDVSYVDFFGMDRIASIHADNSPRFPENVIEETEDYVIKTSKWGATERHWKHAGGVPEFLDFQVKDRDAWLQAKEQMQPSRDRIPWDYLQTNYPKWRQEGAWVAAGFWFGFDVTHSWMVGTERVLMAMVMEPEWIADIINHYLEVDLKLFDMVWDAGYHFDEITWPDDMGYKQSQFFSLGMYRQLVKPYHQRAAEWAHAKGVKVRLHSCGDIRPFVPDLIDLGIDMLNPLEVKAGVDPIALKEQYGSELGFHGGINAVLFENDTMDEILAEMDRVIPVMKQNGGYIIGSDHSVPDSVSLKDFQQFMAKAKAVGSYE